MNTDNVIHLATLAALLSRIPFTEHGAGRIAKDAVDLARLAQRAVTNATNLCNLPNYGDAFDKRQASIQKKAAEILEPYGLEARTTGDPRGSCFRIRVINCPKVFSEVPDTHRAFYASEDDGEDGFRL